MSNILKTPNVLRLNACHMRLGWSTPQEAFCMLMGGKDGEPPALALDIHYKYDEFGVPILDKMESFDQLEWEYWMMLEPRRGNLDTVIRTSKRIIRIPTVIVCANFHTMPLKDQKPTKAGIRRRDGNKCLYTGVTLTNSTFSLDHIKARSRGGRDEWTNLASCHKDVNSKKGNKTNEEAGLRLLKKPLAPKPIPLCVLVSEDKHHDHAFF